MSSSPHAPWPPPFSALTLKPAGTPPSALLHSTQALRTGAAHFLSRVSNLLSPRAGAAPSLSSVFSQAVPPAGNTHPLPRLREGRNSNMAFAEHTWSLTRQVSYSAPCAPTSHEPLPSPRVPSVPPPGGRLYTSDLISQRPARRSAHSTARWVLAERTGTPSITSSSRSCGTPASLPKPRDGAADKTSHGNHTSLHILHSRKLTVPLLTARAALSTRAPCQGSFQTLAPAPQKPSLTHVGLTLARTPLSPPDHSSVLCSSHSQERSADRLVPGNGFGPPGCGQVGLATSPFQRRTGREAGPAKGLRPSPHRHGL